MYTLVGGEGLVLPVQSVVSLGEHDQREPLAVPVGVFLAHGQGLLAKGGCLAEHAEQIVDPVPAAAGLGRSENVPGWTGSLSRSCLHVWLSLLGPNARTCGPQGSFLGRRGGLLVVR